MTETLDILEKLVGFETVGENSNRAFAAYVEDFLATRGFQVHRIVDPGGDKIGLYAEKGPVGGGVLLSAHSDVVPVEGQVWTRNPFRLTREGSRVYGRGTTDMKGFVASALLLAEKTTGRRLREPLKLVISYDEEVGCVGIQRMLDRLVPLLGQPRACLVGEPTDMRVAVGHKGKVALRAVCHGRPGHSALAPNFVNALHLATDFIAALRVLQTDEAEHGNRDSAYTIPYTTFHVGTLIGGKTLNMVPDRAELTFECRHLAGCRPGDIMNRIRDAADRAGAVHQTAAPEAHIEVKQSNAYPGLDVPQGETVIGYAQKLVQNPSTTKVDFGTEAGVFSELGIPTVVCGPGSMEGQGHQPDEYLALEQLAACDAMMDRLLDDLAS
ncbi:MAG: acetylornithine deacetylase [Rhodobacteraceae bacterium]|nr:acetylornithine deacetylase [Paracoccaceae bacterium]